MWMEDRLVVGNTLLHTRGYTHPHTHTTPLHTHTRTHTQHTCVPHTRVHTTHMLTTTHTLAQWEGKVEDGQKNFEEVSETLKKEVKRFEVSHCYLSVNTVSVTAVKCTHVASQQEQRTHEFKTKFISYLEALMHMQQEVS